jgi:hypothetical protein
VTSSDLVNNSDPSQEGHDDQDQKPKRKSNPWDQKDKPDDYFRIGTTFEVISDALDHG